MNELPELMDDLIRKGIIMGWSAHDLPDKDFKLWTRGGTEGVYIQDVDRKRSGIEIPASLLRMLVAEDVRLALIDKIESMETDDLLEYGST